MNILPQIVKPFYEYAIKPLINYEHNLEDLEKRKDKLVDAKERVQRLVAEAREKGEIIERDVEKWLSDADKIIKEAKKFLEENAGDRNFFAGLCFNLVQRHQLSGEAKRIIEEIHEIYEERKFDHGVSYHGSYSTDWNLTLPGYVTFESRERIMREILEALKDHDVKMIGVYGMGGIGKTTLVDAISRRAEEERLFDKLVKVIISQTPNLEHIHGQLADQLELKLDQKTKEGRAAFLRKCILKKKLLFVLDDMWKGFNLEELGIPSMDDCKGCKIVITSRVCHILSNEMNIDVAFEIKDLTEEESWKIFKNIVGKDVETNHELNKIAIKVVKRCGCLPIALVVVAKALKGKPLYTWRDALNQLKSPITSVGIRGVSDELYSSLKLSYNNLETEEAKLLFLLCGMFPEDYEIPIDDLLTCVMGLGILHGINSLGDARDRVLKLVDDLKTCCLLLKYKEGNEHVKMHDVTRDVSIYIASKNDRIYTLSDGQGLNEWQDKDIEGNYTAIWGNQHSIFSNLPKKLRFPRLELLALQGDRFGLQNPHIPDTNLFEGIENLKVLWVEGMNLSPWPPSFCDLLHLKTLSLIKCNLGNIDMISELKELEILNLSGSNIKELPKGINQLVQLKLLDVSYCEELKVIPASVISELKKLEVLHTRCGFVGWETEDLRYYEKMNASLSELNKLSHLTTLSLKVPSIIILTEGAFLENLELKSFEIVIGKTKEHYDSYKTSAVLDIKMDSTNILLDDGLNMLLKKSEELILEASYNGKDILLELDRSDSPHLKYLRLENNSDITYIMSEIDKFGCKMMFSRLECLKLWNMKGLETIIHGPVKAVQVFNKLKTIRLCKCSKLRHMFPLSIMEGLSNLKQMEIRNSEMMETIFVVESGEENNKMECRQLRRLSLDRLPQLMSICATVTQLQTKNDGNHLEIVEENQLCNFPTLFNQQVAFPNLEELRIRKLRNLKMIWPHNQLIANDFCKLREIYLNSCENLRSIFTYNVMGNLMQLQKLSIKSCDSLEQVFEVQTLSTIEKGAQDEENVVPRTCKLEQLFLEDLPNLKKVWSKDPRGVFNFQSLTIVEVCECPKLKSLFPASLTKHLQQLQQIKVHHCGIHEMFEREELPITSDQYEFEYSKVSFSHLETISIQFVDNLEIIWHNQLIVDNLSKLQMVKVCHCKSLKNIFPFNVMRSTIFMKLQQLDIENCNLLEEVFGIDKRKNIEEEEGSNEVTTIKSNNLLCNKPNLMQYVCGIHNSKNLRDVKVVGCPKLKRLFPMSLARHFQQELRRLYIDDCGLDVIFCKEEMSNHSKREFLLTKDAFPNLVELQLESKILIGELWHSTFSRELFPKLKVLHFDSLNDYESTHFSLAPNQLLYHLEELEVRNASLVEIFSNDGLTTIENIQMRRPYFLLKKLSLVKLPKLMRIWQECSQPLFKNLEFLEVKNCSSLKTLGQSSSFSFQSLIYLQIYECHGLINLLNFGVAKTLVQLRRMKLHKCNCMTTVLTEEENEEEKDEIVFSKLEELELYELPKVEQFQSAKCTMKFPNLKRLDIEECPKMKAFSPGIVCTPLLKGVRIRREGQTSFWSGAINDSLQQLWEDASIQNFEAENIMQNLWPIPSYGSCSFEERFFD